MGKIFADTITEEGLCSAHFSHCYDKGDLSKRDLFLTNSQKIQPMTAAGA